MRDARAAPATGGAAASGTRSPRPGPCGAAGLRRHRHPPEHAADSGQAACRAPGKPAFSEGSRGSGGGGGVAAGTGRTGHPGAGARGPGRPLRAAAERGTSGAGHGNARPAGTVRQKRPRCANAGTAPAPGEARRYTAEIAPRCQSRRGDGVSAGSEVAPRLALGPQEGGRSGGAAAASRPLSCGRPAARRLPPTPRRTRPDRQRGALGVLPQAIRP